MDSEISGARPMEDRQSLTDSPGTGSRRQGASYAPPLKPAFFDVRDHGPQGNDIAR